MAVVAGRLSLRSGLRRLSPQVAARHAALGDRRRAVRPGGGRGAGARAGRASSLERWPRGSSASRAERGRRGPDRVRDRHRAARPLVVGGARLARGGRCASRRSTASSWSRWREALSATRPSARPLAASSWGEGKDLRTWDSPRGRRPRLGGAPARAARCCARSRAGVAPRARRARARELLAVQASDWAFLDRRRQAGDYPCQRATDHAQALLEAIDSAPIRRTRACATWRRTSASPRCSSP